MHKKVEMREIVKMDEPEVHIDKVNREFFQIKCCDEIIQLNSCEIYRGKQTQTTLITRSHVSLKLIFLSFCKMSKLCVLLSYTTYAKLFSYMKIP